MTRIVVSQRNAMAGWGDSLRNGTAFALVALLAVIVIAAAVQLIRAG